MLTIKKIKQKTNYEVFGERQGCFVLYPYVELKCRFGLVGFVSVGEIVYVTAVDEDGQYPNTIYLKGKKCWFSVEYFELVQK